MYFGVTMPMGLTLCLPCSTPKSSHARFQTHPPIRERKGQRLCIEYVPAEDDSDCLA